VKHSIGDGEAKAIAREVRLLLETWRGQYPALPFRRDFIYKMESFAAAIALWGARMNLTADPSDPSEIAFHIIDSVMPLVVALRPDGSMLRDAFIPGRSVVDLGAGAGFPGLVLAAGCDARFTLIEARRKRASFLTVTAAEMGLRNVAVVAERAAAGKTGAAFDTVVARAFAHSAEFHPTAAAALIPGAVAVLFANPGQELGAEAARIAGLGSDPVRFEYTVPRRDRMVKRILAVWRKR
jgi:16S rRNA (guanine527-N7)-methyltransferase